ncbi:hypothetical protein GPECTOR_24g280 [Gonium pectorale]|uniref:BTB domain-containing protein n=1 Tax=Gonium pectorale TaxID=33097 RepID=A0A150GI12_GONPE|nr:hypothetical protein GPECTOR_24g280 [Gonium pectorale]|eukprot:KXZ48990.1 hypothetical protein GPECTOR_24g280 [Gonium pectorale]
MAKAGVLQLASTAEETATFSIDLGRLLNSGARPFYNSPAFSDITIIAPDGRQRLCHQVILAASSKRLASVLKSGDFTNARLPVQGVDSDALDSLLESCYTGECGLSLASAAAVYDAAVKLEVTGLAPAIEQFVGGGLSPPTVVPMLERALGVKAARLVEICLGFIRGRWVVTG